MKDEPARQKMILKQEQPKAGSDADFDFGLDEKD